MNYKNHYDNLIEKAKKRSLTGYSERHHIIPKSFGGLNVKENIVKLTHREHFIAHLLLYKMEQCKFNKFKMLKACIMMSGKEIYNSKLFAQARIEFASKQSKLMKRITKFKDKGFWTIKRREYVSRQKVILYKDKNNHPMFGKMHSEKSKLLNEISNSLHIKIFNDNNELMFESFGNFKKFCEENNLPFKSLKQSYQTCGNKKLYCSYNGKRSSPPRNKEFEQFRGWYAMSNKFGHKLNKNIIK